MNDPGLDVAIQENSKTEHEHREEEDIEKETEQTFLNPRFEYPTTSQTPLTHAPQSMVVRFHRISAACCACDRLSMGGAVAEKFHRAPSDPWPAPSTSAP